MVDHSTEKRKYSRYDTELKIYFKVQYELKTKVKFQIKDKERNKILPQKYIAISKNVGPEGICFSSAKELAAGDQLLLEVYLPAQQDPIVMEGEVRWCKKAPEDSGRINSFDTGVLLAKVAEKEVAASVYFDKENHVVWSAVLDAVFGNFRILAQKLNATKEV